MKLKRILARIFRGTPPKRALMQEAVEHPPSIFRGTASRLPIDLEEPVPAPKLVAPIKKPVSSGAAEATGVTIAGSAAVLLLWVFNHYILVSPLEGDAYVAALSLLTIVLTGVLKVVRKSTENANATL